MIRRLGAPALLAFAFSACSEPPPAPPLTTEQPPEGTRAVPDRWLLEFPAQAGQEPQLRVLQETERGVFRDAIARSSLRIEKLHDFSRLWNGVSVRAPRSEVEKLIEAGVVKSAFPVLEVQAPNPVTQSAPSPDLAKAIAMTGVDIAQSSLGLTGAGVRVGIIDTGIDYLHPDLGGCFGPGCRVAFGTDFVGDSYDSSGATGRTPTPDADPMDCGGHGTHVAGIVGANGVVKGIAPEVTFGAYRVFGCSGTTETDIMLQAMEQAAADGMRVVNISIGSAFTWPDYPSAKAASALLNAGVIVVASNGNSGPDGLYAAGAPGIGADVIGVGSIDNTHTTQPAFTVSPDNAKFGFNVATASPVPPASGTFTLERTGHIAATSDACIPLTTGSLMGKVALIRRGTCGFYQKAANAQAAGAVAVILYNNTAGQLSPTVAGTPPITIPVVAITAADGANIDGRITAAATTMTWGSETVYSVNPTAGQVSAFSSWGPTADLRIKPDVSAPGGSIYSTYPRALGSYATLSGTSMAAPHVVGAVALLLEARPSLNPLTIRPALANSAVPAAWPTDATGQTMDSVFHQGAGLIHVDVAAQAQAAVTPWRLSLGESQTGPITTTLTFTNDSSSPLTFDATHLAATSELGDPRTFTRSQSTPATVDFSAPSVTVPAKGSATLDVTITANAALADGSLYSGYLVFTAGPTVLRVPYGGYKGDYQQRQVLTPTAKNYPWLVSRAAAGTNLPSGGTFTLQSTDQPALLVHFEHFARRMVVEAFDAGVGKPYGTVFDIEYVSRAQAATTVVQYSWNGSVAFNKSSMLVPNGTYVLKLRVLKALGDENNPADWETWTSPVITINHP
jgi:subtilisin family serine protease